MKAEELSLEFDGRVLTYKYLGGISTYIGGASPEFRTTTDFLTKYTKAHQDPDIPLAMLSEEMYKDENFWFDPVDCTEDCIVLLCSGNEVKLECLTLEKRNLAIKQKHIAAFQRTIPHEIKERLMQIHCCRWAHYEMFANSPVAMELFDKDPDLIMKAARSHKRHSLAFNPYV